jgi:hypothetical protein
MRADPFASPKRRISRAKEHIADIKSRAGSFFHTKPYARVVERNAQGLDEFKFKLAKPLPTQITDLAYEAIEALRSALDQATHPIAIVCKVKRPDLIHSPIGDDAADVDNILNGRIKEFPADIVSLFRSFQPHQTGNPLIWALNRIRRQSTHRLIVPVGVATAGMHIKRMTMKGVSIPPPRWDSEKDEMIFAVLGSGSQLEYDVDLAFYIAFGPVEGVAGQPVIDTLLATAAEVERIVVAIEADCTHLGLL